MEEFRLLFNLYFNKSSNSLNVVEDDEKVVAFSENGKVKVSTRYLRIYLALKNMTMVIFLENIVRFNEIYLYEEATKIIEENKIENKIDLTLLNSLERSVASRLLAKILGAPIDYCSVVSCIELAKKGEAGSLLNLPNGISFKIERGYAHFLKTSDLKEQSYKIELKNGLNTIEQISMVIAVNDSTEPEGYTLNCELSLDAQKIKAPLYARQKMDGDTIKSGKMTKPAARPALCLAGIFVYTFQAAFVYGLITTRGR